MDPHPSLTLTDRDAELLRVLTQRVRVLSEAQAARTFWADCADPLKASGPRLEQLRDAGLIDRFVMLVHPELELKEPLAVWQPGLPRPALFDIARRLRSRWNLPDRGTPLISATPAAAAMVNGHGGRPLRISEATHDVHLAAVYLRMRLELPTRACSWKSEASLLAKGGGRRQKLPDAMVTDGRDQTAIEFGGSYSADKLGGLHEFCDRRHFGYEVW